MTSPLSVYALCVCYLVLLLTEERQLHVLVGRAVDLAARRRVS